jgi:uncharacterized membrane-anchored protein YhcB (DUF1043 family)
MMMIPELWLVFVVAFILGVVIGVNRLPARLLKYFTERYLK